MKEYKYICKLCKKHPTSEENQLCSECRNKKMGDTQRCIICGNVHTAAPDGIRSSPSTPPQTSHI